jgi:hypothetical protein
MILAKEILATELVNKYLLDRDNEGTTSWQVVEWCGKVNSLQKTWNSAKEKLKTKEAFKFFAREKMNRLSRS